MRQWRWIAFVNNAGLGHPKQQSTLAFRSGRSTGWPRNGAFPAGESGAVSASGLRILIPRCDVQGNSGKLPVRNPARRQDPAPPLCVEGIPGLFTVAEAARLLRVSPSYIRKLMALNLLECVDMGTSGRRIPRFTLSALQRFISERSRTTALNPTPNSALTMPTALNVPYRSADSKHETEQKPKARKDEP